MAAHLLASAHWLGFDLDHTLVRYRLGPLTRLTASLFRRFLVEQRQWPESLLLQPESDPLARDGADEDTPVYPEARVAEHVEHQAAESEGAGRRGDVAEDCDMATRMNSPHDNQSEATVHHTVSTTAPDVPRRTEAKGSPAVDITSGSSNKTQQQQSAPLDEEAFFIKGLLFDTKLGHMLRLQADGTVLGAAHGRERLVPAEAASAYAPGELADVCNALHAKGCRLPRFLYFSTYFDMPGAAVAADMVALVDCGAHPPAPAGELRYAHVVRDLFSALDDAFSPPQFAAGRGGYFSALQADPAAYVHPCTPLLLSWLQGLRAEGARLFVLTNSDVDYATLLLDFAVGKDWRTLFDIVVFAGAKPAFFTANAADSPFFLINGSSTKRGESVHVLERGKLYAGGNMAVLEEFLHRTHEDLGLDEAGQPQKEARVVYFGDHLTGDVQAVAQLTSWKAVAIVEELLLQSSALKMLESHGAPQDCILSRADSESAEHLRPAADFWGHFLRTLTEDVPAAGETTSLLYEHVVRAHGALVTPHLDALAAHSAVGSELHVFHPDVPSQGVHHHPQYSTAAAL